MCFCRSPPERQWRSRQAPAARRPQGFSFSRPLVAAAAAKFTVRPKQRLCECALKQSRNQLSLVRAALLADAELMGVAYCDPSAFGLVESSGSGGPLHRTLHPIATRLQLL